MVMVCGRHGLWPSLYKSKSSTRLWAGVKVGHVHLCRVAGNSV